MKRENYKDVFPEKAVDRFSMQCPDCATGKNSKGLGGNDRCFHCDTCGLIECYVTSPALKEDSIND